MKNLRRDALGEKKVAGNRNEHSGGLSGSCEQERGEERGSSVKGTPGSTVTSEVGAAAIWMRSYLQDQATAGRVGLLRGGFRAGGDRKEAPKPEAWTEKTRQIRGQVWSESKGWNHSSRPRGNEVQEEASQCVSGQLRASEKQAPVHKGPSPAVHPGPALRPRPVPTLHPHPHPGLALVFCVLGDTFFPLSGFRNAYFLLVGSSSS